MMNRRVFLAGLGLLATAPLAGRMLLAEGKGKTGTWPVTRSEQAWREMLSREQYRILREEGTERPWTSPLLDEKRTGLYLCVGCDQPLFSSDSKYDSRTGWPSFFDVLAGAVGTKRDYALLVPRTEYHCSRCGGHHGHVFEDGPKPTGLRYCNNGKVLKFQPS